MKHLLIAFLFLGNLCSAQSKPVYDSLLDKKLGADDYGMKKYVFCILKTGPSNITDKAKKDSLFAGHMKNINRMAEEGDRKDNINPHSLEVIHNAVLEPSLKDAVLGTAYQFIRKGYFCLDKDSTKDKMLFNRTVTLKDAWAKEVKKN